MNDHTLLINQPFALRQRNGVPVFTEIKTSERPRTENEISDTINSLNKQRTDKGLTVIESFDVKYKEMLNKTPKKLRLKTDYPINLHTLERIILTPNAKGYLSTYFLDFMREFNVPIYFINSRGMIESCFMPTYFKKPSLIVKQCEAKINGKNIEIAKYLIKLKIESQGINHLISNLISAKNIRDILAVEANASRIYFQQWDIPVRFNWKGRRGRTLNVNAVDSVNSVLNLGYGLLAQQMSEILLKRGFELSIGFMHHGENNVYWNQLTYDVIEPYRIWIDKEVKDMVSKSIVEPEDFKFSEDRSYLILKDRPLESVLSRFMNALNPLEHTSLPLIRHIESML